MATTTTGTTEQLNVFLITSKLSGMLQFHTEKLLIHAPAQSKTWEHLHWRAGVNACKEGNTGWISCMALTFENEVRGGCHFALQSKSSWKFWSKHLVPHTWATAIKMVKAIIKAVRILKSGALIIGSLHCLKYNLSFIRAPSLLLALASADIEWRAVLAPSSTP